MKSRDTSSLKLRYTELQKESVNGSDGGQEGGGHLEGAHHAVGAGGVEVGLRAGRTISGDSASSGGWRSNNSRGGGGLQAAQGGRNDGRASRHSGTRDRDTVTSNDVELRRLSVDAVAGGVLKVDGEVDTRGPSTTGRGDSHAGSSGASGLLSNQGILSELVRADQNNLERGGIGVDRGPSDGLRTTSRSPNGALGRRGDGDGQCRGNERESGDESITHCCC